MNRTFLTEIETFCNVIHDFADNLLRSIYCILIKTPNSLKPPNFWTIAYIVVYIYMHCISINKKSATHEVNSFATLYKKKYKTNKNTLKNSSSSTN